MGLLHTDVSVWGHDSSAAEEVPVNGTTAGARLVVRVCRACATGIGVLGCGASWDGTGRFACRTGGASVRVGEGHLWGWASWWGLDHTRQRRSSYVGVAVSYDYDTCADSRHLDLGSYALLATT